MDAETERSVAELLEAEQSRRSLPRSSEEFREAVREEERRAQRLFRLVSEARARAHGGSRTGAPDRPPDGTSTRPVAEADGPRAATDPEAAQPFEPVVAIPSTK